MFPPRGGKAVSGVVIAAGGDPEPPSLNEAATEVAEAKAAEEAAEGVPEPTESGPPPAPSAGASASFAPLTSDAETSLATVSPTGPPPGAMQHIPFPDLMQTALQVLMDEVPPLPAALTVGPVTPLMTFGEPAAAHPPS